MVRRIKLSRSQIDRLEHGKGSLEIGCGSVEHRRAGYDIGLDILDHGQEIVWDLHEGIPLPDNSCERIYSSHTFVHIDPLHLVTLFNACWRVLAPGGELYVVVPHMDNPRSTVPGHLSFWRPAMFEYFTGELSKSFTPETLNEQAGIEKISIWSINKLTVNERPDIHCWMRPVK